MISVINAGELRDIIKIVELTSGEIDENGFEVTGYKEVYNNLRCKVKTISTKEFLGAGGQRIEKIYKFICRKRDINEEHFIVYKNEMFNVKHIHEIDAFFIEITGEVKVN